MKTFEYQSYQYFFDLLSFALLLLPCYYALRGGKARRLLLTGAGLYLVYFIAPRLALFYLAFWSLVFVIHRFAFREDAGEASSTQARGRLPGGKIMAVFALTGLPLIILPLVFWKTMEWKFVIFFSTSTNDLLSLLSADLWQIDLCKPVLAPIGLSFATFRAIDLLIKTSLGKITGLSFEQVLFYGFFPPVQVVGPIIEYEEIADQSAKPDPAEIMEGLLRIGVGFIKTFAAASLLEDNARIFETPTAFTGWELWLRLVGYSWFFYLNFSGYSDIAIGVARLFGFVLKENFNFPFFRQNIQGFWNNWHMSLSRWAQRNIFVPCGGYREKTQYTALFLTMLAIAMWHNISASMLVFATLQFLALVLHRKRDFLAAASPGIQNHVLETGRPVRLARKAFYVSLTYVTVLLCFPLLVLKFTKALAFYGMLMGIR